MRILLFGSSGMVGQGVLREALLDPSVISVAAIVRRPGLSADPKLREVIVPDLRAIGTVELQADFDAVLYCVGVTAFGLSETEYTAETYELTLAVAAALTRLNPTCVFLYVSGAGTDSTERGRLMWARVKGRTENALLRLPFRGCYMFRPGVIQPLHGIRSRTAWYRLLYRLMQPLTPLLVRGFPRLVTTTEQLGKAMLHVARLGFARPVLETADINTIR